MLKRVIRDKQRELSTLVSAKKTLHDEEVYEKSRELDQLVVAYMSAKT